MSGIRSNNSVGVKDSCGLSVVIAAGPGLSLFWRAATRSGADRCGEERLWPHSRTEAGDALGASPAAASNARELALFRVAGITLSGQGTYIL